MNSNEMPNKLIKLTIRLPSKRLVFTPSLAPSIIFLIVFPLLVHLGIWQWHRYHYKLALEKNFKHRPAQLALHLSDVYSHAQQQQYYTLQVKGKFDFHHQFLIDNRMHKHQAGYYVITPFKPTSGNKLLLVNRGWIPRSAVHTILPNSLLAHDQHITGLIKLPSNKLFILGHMINKKSWPMVIEAMNLVTIKHQLTRPIYPFIVLLSPSQANGFIRQWRPSFMPSSRHLGYAIQWFALAGTLVIIYLITNLHRE